ncbi:MAG: hypothetical protein IJQ34_01365 [Kiritimatiellae bacterium]|nr:hypothetical protein [Kiritimatiellia bacterium]
MPEAVTKDIADAADMIVNGYAYSCCEDYFRVLNLRTGKAAVINKNFEVIETNMDEVDLSMALGYLSENKKFMR